METLLVVANPLSGKGRSLKIAAKFKARAALSGYHVDVIDIFGRDEMLRAVLDRLKENRESIIGIVCVGGDGLLHCLLPVITEFNLPFTVIPTGTGNDFAREIGALGRTLDQTVSKFSDDPAAIDSVMIKGDGREMRACQVLSLGFDALVNERANSFRYVKGKLKYVIAIIRELPVFKPMYFEITIDGRDYSRSAMLIAIANGPSYGGGMRICPSARFDDGLLDVLILSQVSILELIRVFPKVYSGTHISHPAVEIIQGKEISVNAPATAYADGEYVSRLPISIQVEPASLKVWR